MDIALLSGADKNAGDFLIVARARRLLESLLEGCEVHEFRRNESLKAVLGEVNACDVLVFAGGPGYVAEMYPGRFPLVEDLTDIKPPMFALGMGCYLPKPKAVPIVFSASSRLLLDRLTTDGFGLGCRDDLTAQALRASGVSDVRMTGCPAWYDLERISMLEPVGAPRSGNISQIAVSDPGSMDNVGTARRLVEALQERFPAAQVTFVFHRGWGCDDFTDKTTARTQQQLKGWLEDRGVECIDISYGTDGFALYDACDIHIGFRVHAHIYSLSRRRPSFLLEEDARGFGANDVFGMRHFGLQRSGLARTLKGGARNRLGRDFDLRGGHDAKIVGSLIDYAAGELDGGCPDLRRAYARMSQAFEAMRAHVVQLAG